MHQPGIRCNKKSRACSNLKNLRRAAGDFNLRVKIKSTTFLTPKNKVFTIADKCVPWMMLDGWTNNQTIVFLMRVSQIQEINLQFWTDHAQQEMVSQENTFTKRATNLNTFRPIQCSSVWQLPCGSLLKAGCTLKLCQMISEPSTFRAEHFRIKWMPKVLAAVASKPPRPQVWQRLARSLGPCRIRWWCRVETFSRLVKSEVHQ